MVCLGNICRSPLAQGVAEYKSHAAGLNWEIDSAGTSSWHIGENPDQRSIQVAKENGIDISSQRARQLNGKDLEDFDLVIAMDSNNYSHISNLAKTETERNKIKLLMNFAFPNENKPVPDPYYDGSFDRVFNLVSQAVDALIKEYS